MLGLDKCNLLSTLLRISYYTPSVTCLLRSAGMKTLAAKEAKRKEKSWLTPLSIPERKVGEYAIEHFTIPAGGKVMMNNFRNQMFAAQRGPNFLVYDHLTTWHRLIGPTGTWMTDLPIEHRQMIECLKGMKGRVLVGGLGLGLAASLLAKRKTVKEVVVVEISPEVVELVKDSTPPKVTIHCKDLFKYLKNCPEDRFDYAFFDIWQSDGEETFFQTVVPLIQLSMGKIKNPPVCWNSEVMRGQLLNSIQTRLLFLKPEAKEMFKEQSEFLKKNPLCQTRGSIWHDWSVPYFAWYQQTQPNEYKAAYMAQLYCTIYGNWNWEEIWKIAGGVV